MTCLQRDAIQTNWSRRVRDSLRVSGYYYEPDFCHETDDPEPFLNAARLLGHLYVPPGMNAERPVILTKPSPSAPQWHPFDRQGAIGWHNDFSTRSGRPVLSLSWIRQYDPSAPEGGAWRVASVEAVMAKLCQPREGGALIRQLSARAEAFGYRDAGGWRLFRVIFAANGRSRHRGMRFYGRALEEGAQIRFGRVPERTREIISRVEEAADSVGELFRASKGALLIVDNRYSLHDRSEQQVTGPKDSRRQAWLCFVKRLHQSF
jgi:hypothetical protein